MINLPKISLVFFICTCLILVQSAIMFDDALAQGKLLPPRPGGPGSSAGGNQGDSDDEDILGAIYGELQDLSTGKPGAGLIIMIYDIPIKTDASGKFSLTGLYDGSYVIDLDLPVEFIPAQPSQVVTITNKSTVYVELGYYSATPPSEDSGLVDSIPSDDIIAANFVPSPQTTQQEESASSEDLSPNTMPQTGGEFSLTSFAFLVYLLGVLLWTFGILLWVDP